MDLESLRQNVARTLGDWFPVAKDCSSADEWDVNRELDEWMQSVPEGENRFEPCGEPVRAGAFEVELQSNEFRHGRYASLRFVAKGMHDAADPASLAPALDELRRRLRDWGEPALFDVRSAILSDGRLCFWIGLLVDPLPLGLVVRDEQGRAGFRGTRLRVADIVSDRLAFGWSPREIRSQHPGSLTPQQVHSAFAWWHAHREEIEDELEEERRSVEKARGTVSKGA